MAGNGVTYGFHGVAEAEQAILRSMIERICRRLPGPAVHAPASVAQLVFFEGRPPLLDAPRVRLVRLAKDVDAQGRRDSLRMPPHVTDLIELFTDLVTEEARPQGHCGLMNTLVRSLYELFQGGGAPHALIDGDGGGLVLYPADRQFAWSGREDTEPLAALFRSHRLRGLSLRPLDGPGVEEGRQRRGIEPLFWHMGLAHAPCGLLPWVRRDDLLKMRAWPYLTGQGPATATRLAAVLRAKPRSVGALADAARVPEADAVAFANAALLCGFVTHARPDGAEAMPSGPRLREAGAGPARAAGLPGILGAIRDALRIRA